VARCALNLTSLVAGTNPSQASQIPSEEDSLYVQVVRRRRIFPEIAKKVEEFHILWWKIVVS